MNTGTRLDQEGLFLPHLELVVFIAPYYWALESIRRRIDAVMVGVQGIRCLVDDSAHACELRVEGQWWEE